jgi:hypothetical protein
VGGWGKSQKTGNMEDEFRHKIVTNGKKGRKNQNIFSECPWAG